MRDSIQIHPFILLALAIPVLLLGEVLVRRIQFLSRFNIPTPVAGGMVVALGLLALELAGVVTLRFDTRTTAKWWTWLITPEPEWAKAPAKQVMLPFMVAFFTCVGLNASWDLIKRGGRLLVVFLALATVLAILQNFVGLALAWCLKVSPLLGMICGGMTMTGGMGVGMGFAQILQDERGFKEAGTLIAAAATFGLVSGGLVGGPLATWLIRRNSLRALHDFAVSIQMTASHASILRDLKETSQTGASGFYQFMLLLLCMKAGAWLSYGIQKAGFTFPVQIGAIILGALLRNILDLNGIRILKSETVDLFAAVSLGIFLSVAMMSLNLAELAAVALPMFVILMGQVVVMIIFAIWITFPATGKDYEAAVIAAGHCGFALGATPNAVANMKRLVESFGPAPRAFLIVPIVGGFLIDIPNSLGVAFFLDYLK